jgi:hypothetical protein
MNQPVNEEYIDGFVRGYQDAVDAACEFYPDHEQDIEEHYNPFGERFSWEGPDLKATSDYVPDYVRGYQAAFNLAYYTTLKNLNESLGGNMPPVLPAG